MVRCMNFHFSMSGHAHYVVIGGMTFYLGFILYYMLSIGLLDSPQPALIAESPQDMIPDIQDQQRPLPLHRGADTENKAGVRTQNRALDDALKSSTVRKTIQILFVTKVYERDIASWTYGQGYHPFKKPVGTRPACEISDCELTTDMSKLSDADAVFFSAWDWLNSGKPALPRRAGVSQVWLYFVHETPIYVSHQISGQLNDVFNATMSYMLDADIPYRYVSTETLGSQPAPPVAQNFAAGRTKPILWIVSRCESQSKREVYIEQLVKFIPVDIYGHCSGKACPGGIGSESCIKDLAGTYKFFIAGENSLCQDYLTEKVSAAYDTNLVPILIGGANYSRLLPPHSYIDIRDFSSPAALAAYIQQLHGNDDLYNAYFAWKSSWYIRTTQSNGFEFALCNMCHYLHTHAGQRKTYNMDEYFDENKRCMQPASYYKGITDLGPFR